VLTFTRMTGALQEPFRQGLRDHGYVEGQNILVEWRAAEGRPDRAKALAVELAQLKVDVIVANLTPAVQAAKNATSTIPIVMASAGDRVGTGFVASLARPGGNITGMTGISAELSGKRIELLTNSSRASRALACWSMPPIPSQSPCLKRLRLPRREPAFSSTLSMCAAPRARCRVV
jgi:ABC transporter substrate binding protein